MKIAYLIMAHTDAPQLGRLIKALNVDGTTDFYVHIDSKSDISPFNEVVSSLKADVCFTDKRIYTTWGGYSQVLAYQELIRKCVNSKVIYDRVFLLSGLDYPLWPNNRIISYFEQHPEVELIKAINITGRRMAITKCKRYHLLRDSHISGELRRYLLWGVRNFMRILPFRKNDKIWTNGKFNDIYFGSVWFGLTGRCAEYLHNQLTLNPDWEKYFKTAMCPDELIAATIIFNSPFAKNAILHTDHTKMGLVNVTHNHYIEYDTHIHIYDENDYDKLIQSDKMFVRKLTSNKSLQLIAMIDRYRQ